MRRTSSYYPPLRDIASRADKKAMRNSLVRFGKRTPDEYRPFGDSPLDGGQRFAEPSAPISYDFLPGHLHMLPIYRHQRRLVQFVPDVQQDV